MTFPVPGDIAYPMDNACGVVTRPVWKLYTKPDGSTDRYHDAGWYLRRSEPILVIARVFTDVHPIPHCCNDMCFVYDMKSCQFGWTVTYPLDTEREEG